MKFISEESGMEECVVKVADFDWLLKRAEKLEIAVRYYSNLLREDQAAILDQYNEERFDRFAREALKE